MSQTCPPHAAWYRATTLTERLTATRLSARCEASGLGAPDTAGHRLRRWRSQAAFADTPHFIRRLEADGLTEEDLLHLLAEPPEALCERFAAPPAWLVGLEEALARPDASPLGVPFPETSDSSGLGFLHLVGPLLDRGLQRLRDGIQALHREHPAAPFDPATAEQLFLANLPGRLLPLLSRTLVLELNVARLRGLLEGDDEAQRFQSFLRRLRRPEVARALLEEYPVLARQAALRIDQWVDSTLEFLRNLCADWDAVRAVLSPDEDPGPLAEVRGGAGDGHRGGRSVMIVRFASGLHAVYKPKSLAVDQHFQELLAWLNERGDHPPFRTLRVLDRGDHGWVEFVAAAPCVTADEVRRFYQRQGGYLALLHALQATDFHFENLIAAGEHPVLIDLEALFHPNPEGSPADAADELAGSALARSVLRVGLLPVPLWHNEQGEGLDLSGLGGAPGQLTPQPMPYWEGGGTDRMHLARKRMTTSAGQNRPTLASGEVRPEDHADEIALGFTAVYRLLATHRDELLADDGPLARFAGDEVRVILRHTRTYGLLLWEGFHPDLLRDGLDRDRFFDRLWFEAGPRPWLVRVISSERTDLHEGDIPLFTTQPGSCHLWDSAGRQIPDYFGESGLELARRHLSQLSGADLGRQLWFLRAALATLTMSADGTQHPVAGLKEPRGSADRERLLTAAAAVGDRLEALALRAGDGASWVGLTLVNERRWALLPLGADLYAGLPGVAVFLAYLGDRTGQERYTALARAAVATLRRLVRRHQAQLTAVGGFNGWGGLVWALTHLSALWDDHELWAEVEEAVDRLPPLVERDEQFDVIGGSAGCLAALLALHRHAPSRRVLRVAELCGDRLLAAARPTEHGLGWAAAGAAPLTGFSHGAAGVAWALLELAEVTGADRFRAAALGGVAHERGLFRPEAGNWPDLRDPEKVGKDRPGFGLSWCHGAPGIGLARLCSLRHLDQFQTLVEIETALRTTLAHGFGGNHSLCHGDLGNLELLLQAGATLDPYWRVQADRLAAAVLDGIDREGWLCGIPGRVESPGLMTGLAGIGYGLLRLAEPARVPSVLMLAPPPR